MVTDEDASLISCIAVAVASVTFWAKVAVAMAAVFLIIMVTSHALAIRFSV